MPLIILFSNCKKKEKPPTLLLPIITTDTIINITQSSAVSGGKILSDGGTAILEKGVCWSKNINPTILEYKTSDGNGLGRFSSNIINLSSNTTYYVRAYATNSVGTSYGNQLVFITGTFTDIDGNIYHQITIGTQVWMLENLKTSRYRNGDIIPNVSDNSQWSVLVTGACNYANNNLANLNTEGRTYNWYAVADSRNICPVGWHIPNDTEWNTLSSYLGGGGEAGGKMKEIGTTHWLSPNSNATNTSGFSGIASGTRDYDGTFKEYLRSAYYWSLTSVSSTNATGWYLFYNNGTFQNGSYNKKDGFIVRCLKD